MVTVLLPGLVEALCKLLVKSVRLVENGEAQDVDSVVQKAVQSLEGKLLREARKHNIGRRVRQPEKVVATERVEVWGAQQASTHTLREHTENLPLAFNMHQWVQMKWIH